MLRYIEWIKTNPVPINSKRFYLTNAREVAIVGVKGAKPTFNSEYHNGVFKYPIHRDGGKRIHPTQKPLSLMKELITIHTNTNDVVIDPFCGSSTTLVACYATGRKGLGSEVLEKYYTKSETRLEKIQ